MLEKHTTYVFSAYHRNTTFQPLKTTKNRLLGTFHTRKFAQEDVFDVPIFPTWLPQDSHGHLLDELNVPVSLRTSPEGKFSMYVDAVTNTCAPSSYADQTSYISYTNMKKGYPTW